MGNAHHSWFLIVFGFIYRLSENALKDFLKSEVLDKYSFLYKQKAENSAPNGSNLESWLQKMLAQMQTSIQNHVTSAMDGAEIW